MRFKGCDCKLQPNNCSVFPLELSGESGRGGGGLKNLRRPIGSYRSNKALS